MVLTECPVINAGNDQGLRPQAGSSPDDSQQGVVAHWQHQPLGETCCRLAAERQTQMMDDIFQPCRPARPGRENIIAEPFGKNLPPTMPILANEPPRDNPKLNFLPGAGQIRHLSGISTMNSLRHCPA
jgi:hypothetical protein